MNLLLAHSQFFDKSPTADQNISGKSSSCVDQSVSGTRSPTEKRMSQNQTPFSHSVQSSQSQELCSSTEYTESQKSVISLSTTSISQTNSQTSVISLSTDQSEDDMFNNVSTESSNSDTSTTSTPNQFIDHRNVKIVTDKDLKNVTVSKATVSKFNGSVTDDNQRDSQILILGSFHKQPLIFKMISKHQSLTTKLELLEQDQTQTLLEQTSPAKHDQIFLQIINNAIKQMKTVITKKSRKQKFKSDMNDNFELENDFNEPIKKKPKFQLRIVLKNKAISMKKSKADLNQDNQ